MHTLGYSFKPWTAEKSIADGPSIMAYLRETVAEYDIEPTIRFHHKVVRAEWDSTSATWTVHALINESEVVVLTRNFLFMCSVTTATGAVTTRNFPAVKTSTATLFIHSNGQKTSTTQANVWSSLARERPPSPSFLRLPVMLSTSRCCNAPLPGWSLDPTSTRLRQRSSGSFLNDLLHPLIRAKNTFFQQFFYKKTRTDPETVKGKLLQGVRALVGPDVDVERHFTPTYNRGINGSALCQMVISSQRFEVGQHLWSPTASSHSLKPNSLTSGEHLNADIIVTATGLELVTLGDMDFVVDGATVDFADTFTYRGVAYSDVPNLVSTFGYINASWTLRADLTSAYVCRLLNHMKKTSTNQATPRLRADEVNMSRRPWIDDFSSGYMQRMMPMLPKQGDREPWTNPQRLAPDKSSVENQC